MRGQTVTRTQHHARRWLLPVAIVAAGTGSAVYAQGNHAAGHAGPIPHNEQGHAVDPTAVVAASALPPGRSTLAPCYANCDQSTTAPVLNVNDFGCFLNRFAAGEPAANCDGSTAPPVLNVLDFVCFLNAFAAGCS